MKDIRVVFHDIRSAHNVGSMFRTADAGGVSHIYITGYTPTPMDRFDRVQPDIAKTALGAENSVPWEHVPERSGLLELLEKLKKEGFSVIGLEQDERSVDYREMVVPDKVVILVGNEVEGIDPVLIEVCDSIAEIPMQGTKESLNVSVAFGIALFRFIS